MTGNKNFAQFVTLWIGQFVSLLGSRMTRFALLIWVYEQTGQATALALLGVFSWMTTVIFSPLAGYWIDRIDRKRVMLYADTGAGIMTIVMLLLITGGSLQLWHLYLATAITGMFNAFQEPAYYAASSMMIPKKHYARANGLRALAGYSSDIFAPFTAGFLYAFIGVEGIMLIDVGTFLFAVITLLFIHIPAPRKVIDDIIEAEGIRQQMLFGWRFLRERRGLMGLTLTMMVINLLAALTYFSIFPAMILARTGGDQMALASVEAALGLGGVVGSIVMTITGGFRRKIHGALLCSGLSFMVGDFIFGASQSVTLWIVAAVSTAFFIPFITGSQITIYQMKIPPAFQGRVFAVQNAMRNSMFPIGFLLGGVLADFVFEPAMMPDGALAPAFGWLVGTGDGAGMALMFILTAICGTAMGFGGYLFPALRNVERDLPDFDDEAE